jgi:hypothetical protein
LRAFATPSARRLALLLAGVLTLTETAGAMASASPVVPCRSGASSEFASFASLPAPASLEVMRHIAPGVAEERLRAMIPWAMADRDADWQVTDVAVIGRPLPARRFILGTEAGDQLHVWYESGGIAHLFHVAIFTRGGRRLVRHLAAGSLATLCDALASGKMVSGQEFHEDYW